MDVVGIGIPFMDLLLGIEELPPRDAATVLNDYARQGGGKVATALVAAARLGCSATMMAVVGNDGNGDFIKQDFLYNGVDISQIITQEAESPFVVAVSERMHGDRRFLGTMGNVRKLVPEDINLDTIASASVLHLEGVSPATILAAKTARKHKTIVTYDADYYTPQTAEILPLIDVFIGSQMYYEGVFAAGSYEQNCREILRFGVSKVIFTLGSKGCVGCDDKGYFALPSFDVPVVDTTGAGDVFHGAYIAAMLEGRSHEEAARFASATSAIKCTRLGGRTAIANHSTVVEFLKTSVIDYKEIDYRSEHYRRTR